MLSSISLIEYQSVCSAILGWLFGALFYGTILAVLTWAVIAIAGKRLRPSIVVVLWSIVLIKFLVPLGPSSSVSLASACEAISQLATGSTLSTTQADAAQDSLLPSPGNTNQGNTQQTASSHLTFSSIAIPIYGMCVITLLIVRWRSYRNLYVQCLALSPSDDDTESLVRDVCARLGVKKPPLVRMSEEFPAPFVLGFFRPVLVINRHQFTRPSELETVIVHEVTHLLRGDMFVRLLQWTVGSLLFFWPVIAWINHRLDMAREFACDDWALRHGKLSASEYAWCLLQVVRLTRMPSPALAYEPTCMAGNGRTIERRIDVILDSSNRASTQRAWVLLTLGIVLIWCGFALAGPAEEHKADGAKQWQPTNEHVEKHSQIVIDRVGQTKLGDANKDGKVSYWEKTAYVVSLAIDLQEDVLKEHPYADENGDGELSVPEAARLIRGLIYADKIDTKIKKVAKKNEEAGIDNKELKSKHHAMIMSAFHDALDIQQWLLDSASGEPSKSSFNKATQYCDELQIKEMKKKEGQLKKEKKAGELKKIKKMKKAKGE